MSKKTKGVGAFKSHEVAMALWHNELDAIGSAIAELANGMEDGEAHADKPGHSVVDGIGLARRLALVTANDSLAQGMRDLETAIALEQHIARVYAEEPEAIPLLARTLSLSAATVLGPDLAAMGIVPFLAEDE